MTQLPIGPDGLPLPNLGNPDFQGLREFVVTLKEFDHKEGFLCELGDENSTCCHIPTRSVECVTVRGSQRSSSHMLTHDEAVALAHDPRVLAVELNPKDRGLVIDHHGWSSTSTFTKAFTTSATDIDWGIYRTRSTSNIPNWGSGNNQLLSSNVLADCSGKNVDVVIIDGGLPFPTTLEYAQNSDGTGYSRMVSFNWFQYTNAVTGGTNGSYRYAYSLYNYQNDHQAHTSGTTAGNTQGFARDANIYNLSYNDSNQIEYVKQFHINKPVNPVTGVKNPTITNNSWGMGIPGFSYASVSSIVYRGTTYNPTSGSASNGTAVWDTATLATCKLPIQFGGNFPGQDAATDANFIDAAKSGVINVCSAGNSFFYIDVPTGPDWNNYLIHQTYGTLYYNRGSSPGSAVDTNNNMDYSPICVGAYGAVQTGTMSSNTIYIVYGWSNYTTATGILSSDYKSEFSNYGPRIDVFAPGECITSVIATGTSYLKNAPSANATDARMSVLVNNNGYKNDTANNILAKDAGTSMAGPHVTGVMACILEKYPRMNQSDVRNWIKSTALPTLQSTTGGAEDATDAAISSASPNYSSSSNNTVLFFPGTRVKPANISGYYPVPYPNLSSRYRSTSGQIWPRPITAITRNSSATFNLSASSTTISNTTSASVLFNNNAYSEFLATTNNSVLQMNSSIPYTIECWINLSFLPSSNGEIIVAKGFYVQNALDYAFAIQQSGTKQILIFYYNCGLSGSAPQLQGVSSSLLNLSLNQWYHVAVTIINSKATFWFNGTAVGTSNTLPNFVTTTNPLFIGGISNTSTYPISGAGSNPLQFKFTGFISNLRITKGVAVYTGTYTVPTSPLTATQSSGTNISAISGSQTSLLTCQTYDSTGTLVADNSTNSLTVNQYIIGYSGGYNQYTLGSIVSGQSYTQYASPFWNDSASATTITLTTTNVPTGTVIPYIITARPKSTSGSTYSFSSESINGAPLSGNLSVSNGTALLPLIFTTSDSLIVTVRLAIYNSPTVVLTVN